MLVFITASDKLQVVAKSIDEIAELFASSLGRDKLCPNKKECFLEFTKDNQVAWCERSFNKNNIHLVTKATIVKNKNESLVN